MISLQYDHHSKAQTGVLVFGLLSGPLLAICTEALKFIQTFPEEFPLASVMVYLEWLFMLSPTYALIDGMNRVVMIKYGVFFGLRGDGLNSGLNFSQTDGDHLVEPTYCRNEQTCWDSQSPGCCETPVFGISVASRCLAYMLIEAMLAMIYLWRTSNNSQSASVGQVEHPYSVEDIDVAAERERVRSLSASTPQAIVLDGLHHEYPDGKIGLHELTFAVAKGSCFGFLGPNGAGKTTSIKVLTGVISATSGTARLSGFDVRSQHAEARHAVGYCPQFDGLLDMLTVKEHIKLFAELRGLPKESVHQQTTLLIEYLELTNHQDTLAHNLSGGTKRKLSMAIALVGSPPVLLLDEPSCGLDPVARRQLWRVIDQARCQGSTVLLTTHSMEECEALASRIGILLAGKLRCIGTSQQLKTRFGKGYYLSASLGDKHAEVIRFLSSQCDQVQVIRQSKRKCELSLTSSKPLSALMAIVLQLREQLGVSEVALSQPTLEQIFNWLVHQHLQQQGLVEPCSDVVVASRMTVVCEGLTPPCSIRVSNAPSTVNSELAVVPNPMTDEEYVKLTDLEDKMLPSKDHDAF